jgi:hypothetical protein
MAIKMQAKVKRATNLNETGFDSQWTPIRKIISLLIKYSAFACIFFTQRRKGAVVPGISQTEFH